MRYLLLLGLIERPSEPLGFRRPFLLADVIGGCIVFVFYFGFAFFRRPIVTPDRYRYAGILSGVAILFCPTIYCANVATGSPMRRFRYAYWY